MIFASFPVSSTEPRARESLGALLRFGRLD